MQPQRIPLYRRDGSIRAYALVDAADFEVVAPFRWHLGSNGYARRNLGSRDGRRLILLHRQLLGLALGDARHADHVNRDKLDNRRANLRIVTRGQNRQNVPTHKGATSRFRGVYLEVRRGRAPRWRAGARISGRHVHLGSFQSELDAALAVNAWRLENMPYAEPDPELAAPFRSIRPARSRPSGHGT